MTLPMSNRRTFFSKSHSFRDSTILSRRGNQDPLALVSWSEWACGGEGTKCKNSDDTIETYTVYDMSHDVLLPWVSWHTSSPALWPLSPPLSVCEGVVCVECVCVCVVYVVCVVCVCVCGVCEGYVCVVYVRGVCGVCGVCEGLGLTCTWVALSVTPTLDTWQWVVHDLWTIWFFKTSSTSTIYTCVCTYTSVSI